MKKYKTLKALVEAVRSGEVDESKLLVFIDNDYSTVSLVTGKTDEYGDPKDIDLYRGEGGYGDADDLWPIVFPQAEIDFA